jgi:hypothetical protein
MILRAPSRGVLRAWGLALALFSVVAPALPLGPLFAQPPIPLAALWAAYGWAAEDESGWRAPLALSALGLLHDQLAGEPYGLFVAIYLSAYLAGRIAAVVMSSPNLVSLWGGFIVTALATIAVAAIIAPIAHGGHASVLVYAQAAGVTALLFPIARPLYMSATGAPRVQGGGRP